MDDDWAENLAILPTAKMTDWVACAVLLAQEAEIHHAVVIQNWGAIVRGIRSFDVSAASDIGCESWT